DAYITKLYLATYNSRQKNIKDFVKAFYEKAPNPYPYIFALWFNDAVAGSYGKKTADNQLMLLDKILDDKKAPGTLVAAANYQKGNHYLFSAEFDKAKGYYDNIGSIGDWQFAGPFENLSQSGFYKDYGPLEHPEPDAVFTSLTNAEVKWFTPAAHNQDSYIPAVYSFNKSTAIIYAQSFVNSPSDRSVYCNVGITGSIKVWINDELVIAEPRERVTEMDAYTVKCNLRKGINRVLVQLGYSKASYPNFILRFTDENHFPVHDIVGSAVYAPYPKIASSSAKYELIPHYAEAFFTEKVKDQPDNLVNYLLLADTYLRTLKLTEARNVITNALKRAPDNSLLRLKLVNILDQENDHTLYLEELEKIKLADPESILVSQLKVKELYDNEKYDECETALNNMIQKYGEDQYADGYRLILLAEEKKYDDLLKVAQEIYTQYPDNAKLVPMMYSIKKDVEKNNNAALGIYEKFMKDNYDYDTYVDYANILIDRGDIKKGLGIKEKLCTQFSYDPTGYYNLSKYYYTTKDYDGAEQYIHKALAIAPYNEDYWSQLGDIESEKQNTAEALKDYNRSLKYDPNQYEVISKIRKLNNEPDISNLFSATDIDKIISADNLSEAKNVDYGYYYILDQKNAVIYPDGATEQYCTYIIRITNDKGVENYKESAINYSNSQSLLIQKAEVIKSNHTKIEGERNDNQIVFTNLEAGDIIVFQYRLQSFVYGRFAKEYWDRYQFGGKIYAAITRYNLLAPSNVKIQYVFTHSDLKPAIQNVENFKEYSWEIKNPEPMKDEPLMPLQIDEGNILHISTISSWKDIASWYSDIANNKAEEDFEITELYKQLFPAGKKLSQFEKAKIIYDYIESNIKYSSVSFRQSDFVPQRAAAVVSTRLGDCKDLSSLYVTLSHMAGIDAQMVLVQTRDNGGESLVLPCVEFNHCIARTVLDNKPYFIELTDNHLPFTAIPNDLQDAQALVIPNKPGDAETQLIHLTFSNRSKDEIKREIHITPADADLLIKTRVAKYGAPSSSIRDNYANLDNKKQMQDLEKSIASGYKNNVTLLDLSFTGLDSIVDSVTYTYNYKVKDAIADIGDLHTFQVVYPDVVATLDNFSADSREYPVEYWNYENVDIYETTVYIDAPKGSKFSDLPANTSTAFKNMKYSLLYTLKAPDKLIITRKFYNDRPQQISSQDYPAFKSFFEKIVKAEQKYIVYK
ncbi:MAG TPA: DUF3857 domain-containing protein, partial [Chitinophagaceae bacterium]|nr:DUF3857 domain-containing protein [Chitinophagaceae bacterium]